MPDVVRLQLDRAADAERWRAYVDARDDAHCADLPQWRALFSELYGIEHHSFVCREGDRDTGALSLYRIDSPFMGKMLLTCPFFGYGGFYWDSDAARDALIAEAERCARESGVDFLELRLRAQLS